MSIKFNCPHCRKPFNVKDELAGRRAQCPACKKTLTVPAPRAQPADLEAFAAAALADEPKPQVEPAPAEQPPIEFECPYCNEKVKVATELSGKQAPCPECRRIIKVPLLKKEEAKDWRKLDTRLPAGARRDEAPVPEGAWSTSSIGTVSRTALIEAQAIPQTKTRWTWQQWARYGTATAAALVLFGLGTWIILGRIAASDRKQALTSALGDLDPGKYSPEAIAEVHRAAGDYFLQANQPDDARTQYLMARAALMAATDKGSFERELALIDLVLSQVQLGGDPKQIDERTRLRWDDAHKEIRQTWQNLGTPEGRKEAIQRLSRELIARNQSMAAVSLVSQAPERSELLAVVALEMLHGQQESPEIKKRAAELAVQAERLEAGPRLQPPLPNPAAIPGRGAQPRIQPGAAKPNPVPGAKVAEPGPHQPAPAPSLVALWLVLGKADKALAIGPPPQEGKKVDVAILLGYIQGLARLDSWDVARRLIQLAPTPLDRLRAIEALAAVADDKEKLDLVRSDLETGVTLAQNEIKRNELPPWLLYRLAQLSVQAGLAERVKGSLELLPEALRGRVQLQELQARLAGAAESAETSWADAVDEKSVARGLALEAITRHNGPRLGSRTLLKEVAGWKVEKLRPFGYIGIALGLQDRDQ
jgi:hypothetical protein